MLQALTDAARQALANAQREAAKLGHEEIGTEHLLLGVLGLQRRRTIGTLDRLGVTLEEVRNRVIGLDGHRAALPPNRLLPLTAEAKRALESAVREAHIVHAEKVTPEHLLLALASHRDSLAARILAAWRVDVATLRGALGELAGATDEREAAREDDEHRDGLDLSVAEAVELVPRLVAVAAGVHLEVRRYADADPTVRLVCEPGDGEAALRALLDVEAPGFRSVLTGGRVVKLARCEPPAAEPS